MIFASYAIFLLATIWAVGRTLARRGAYSVSEAGYGSSARVVLLAVSLGILLLSVASGFGSLDEQDAGALIWGALIAGSAFYALGAASWTGGVAFALRALGWACMAGACLYPSTLTLGLPLVALLLVGLAPITEFHVPERGTGGFRSSVDA